MYLIYCSNFDELLSFFTVSMRAFEYLLGFFFIVLNIYTETCKQEMTNYNALNLIGMCGVFLR